jgi:hypothetical protein
VALLLFPTTPGQTNFKVTVSWKENGQDNEQVFDCYRFEQFSDRILFYSQDGQIIWKEPVPGSSIEISQKGDGDERN